jgi:galactose-1-phosphate uridylyltransferase
MPETPHRRYNPLLDEWVLCSPQRLDRPWQGEVAEAVREDRPRYDPSCYLCPGNVRANGQRNPDYRATFAFENDFPALVPGAGAPPASAGGLLRSEPATGRCRVLCFSPRHDLTLAVAFAMGFHGRPTDGEEHPWWRLHAVFFPPLLRSASVRKFLVGFELTAEPQRDLTPEEAAARLRAQPETHYRKVGGE